MTKKDFQFPSEEVKLPSKGLLYPKNSALSNGFIEMKYMTAKEEDILTNQNFIENGTVIDRLLESLIITDFDYNDLLIGDKNALLVAARILGYGSDYDFMFRGEKISIDLSKIEDKELDESLVVDRKNEFNFELPTSKIPITFKFLTHKDEKNIDAEIKSYKKINKNVSIEGSTRLKNMITSIDGNREIQFIRDFVDQKFLARDSRAFRNYYEEIQPSTDLTYSYEDRRGNITKIDIPVGIKFFWPDVTI